MTDNKTNERLISFSVAELSLLASALQTAAATAVTYGDIGRKSRHHLRDLYKMTEALCPFSVTSDFNEYAWFNAFSSLPTAGSYAVVFEDKRSDYGIGKALVHILVDDACHTIYKETLVNGKAGDPFPIVDDNLDLLRDLVKEVVGLDAVEMAPVDVIMSMPNFSRDGFNDLEAKQLRYARKTILSHLSENQLPEFPVHPVASRSDWSRSSDNSYIVTIYARPEHHEVLSDFGPSLVGNESGNKVAEAKL